MTVLLSSSIMYAISISMNLETTFCFTHFVSYTRFFLSSGKIGKKHMKTKTETYRALNVGGGFTNLGITGKPEISVTCLVQRHLKSLQLVV